MKQQLSQKSLIPVAVSLILIIVIVNTALLARSAGFWNLPGEMSNQELAGKVSEMVVEYYEQQAIEAGVGSNSAVRDTLAQLGFEIDKAATSQNIVAIQAQMGPKVQEIILREQDNKRRDTVLNIIKQDSGVANYSGQAIIGINKNEQDGLVISDAAGILSEGTVNSLKQNEQMKGNWNLIEVKVAEGKAELLTSRTLIDRLKLAETEREALQSKLDEIMASAGYKDLTGSGIVVKLFDAEEGFSTVDIVHDRDVRDVVNELFAAGASGVAVGGQRLTSTSSIRCAGPVILVNQQQISVNPIVIEAAGNPEVLGSSLDLIKSQLKEFGIRVEISSKEQLVIPAFKDKK